MHPHDSRLVDLVMGLLSPDEANATRDHIRQCPECESRLRVIIGDRESVRSGPMPTLVNGRIELTTRPRRPSILMRASLVAALFAIVALGVFLARNRPDGPPEYWIPVTSETSAFHRGDTHGGVTDVLSAYRAHDAATAVTELQALTVSPDDKTASTLRGLYLASALINADRADEGVEILNSLEIEFMPTPWRYEAEWVKYIGLRRADRDDEARTWLTQLANAPGDNQERARSELDGWKSD